MIAKGDKMEIQPFVVDVPQTILDDLQERLARTRWPDEVEDAGWDYGTNLAYVQALVEYWRARFDWRGRERAMNALPDFRAERSYADIRRWTAFPRGGHFIAAEEPRLLAEELRAFFRPLRQSRGTTITIVGGNAP
jgi:hypothetical protein